MLQSPLNNMIEHPRYKVNIKNISIFNNKKNFFKKNVYLPPSAPFHYACHPATSVPPITHIFDKKFIYFILPPKSVKGDRMDCHIVHNYLSVSAKVLTYGVDTHSQ